VNDHPMINVSITVSQAATDASEVARRLPSCVQMTDFDAERTARILDRLAEELAEAAADVRRAR
jgi:hypothetical protein